MDVSSWLYTFDKGFESLKIYDQQSVYPKHFYFMTTNSSSTMVQLKDKLLAASQDEIARVVQEAQDEALQEAKAMLKERMLEAILKDAIDKVNVIADEPAVLIVDEQAG